MKFIKGQWYVIGNDYYEYNEVRCTGLNDNLHWFRKAGELNETPFGDPIATPASLTPDFSNAKVGDECFSAADGVSVITGITNGYYIDIEGNDYAFYSDGMYGRDDKYPTLFNSFAQFISYWAEEGLKMKGGSDA